MRNKINYFGFGFNPDESQHHFLVTMPNGRKNDADVFISEHYCWHDPSEGKRTISLTDKENQVKVGLQLRTWNLIVNQVQYEFNRRLKGAKAPVGKWTKSGATPVNRVLGKELVLLCWALEDCDPALATTALSNWLGLAPEERWWLYTMTNAACGDPVQDRNRGWRRAIRYALTDNPVSEKVLQTRNSCFEHKVI